MVLLQRENSVGYIWCWYKGRVVWGTHGVVTKGGQCVVHMVLLQREGSVWYTWCCYKERAMCATHGVVTKGG